MDNVIIEDMWTPYKHMYMVLQASLANPNGPTSELEQCLKKYKQYFTNFLRNPPKSEKSRSNLCTALVEGVTLVGQSRKVQISRDLVDEAIILSDMFNLDEIFALELLCTAQKQMMHHAGLPRGLVAILLYYDGRKAIASTLRDMFQAVNGVVWSAVLPRELASILTTYAQNLVEDTHILTRILELLAEMDIDKEILLLTKNRAFGSKKHKNQVLALFEYIRKALAMALFHWSAQRGLPTAIAIRLMQHLATYKSSDATGNIDDVALIMLMALLYSYDTSVLQMIDLSSVTTGRLPILSDPEFAPQFYDALYAQSNWQSPNLSGIIKFSFGVAMASLRHAATNLQSAAGPIINQDDHLVDDALSENVFNVLYRQLLEKDIVYSTEYIYRRLHNLIADFIDFMHAKVTEIRGRADETAHTIISCMNEGLEVPSNLDSNYELLMLCVAKLYGDPRVTIKLCDQFWGPKDTAIANYTKQTSRSISLFKFINLASELLPHTLFKSYLHMITGLTRTRFSARCAFNLLKEQQLTSTSMSWDKFFMALANYYNNLRKDNLQIMYSGGGGGGGGGGGLIGGGGDSMYRNRFVTARSIDPRELEHLLALMGILRAVAEHDEASRVMLCDHTTWQTTPVLLGLVACSAPMALKADILFTVAALAKSRETAQTIWQHLEDSQIITTLSLNSSVHVCSLADEIEQNEGRTETYRTTRGILELLHTLLITYMPRKLGAGPRKPGAYPYIKFMMETVLLKFTGRSYKDPAEKWQVGTKCLKIAHYALANYQPQANDFFEQSEIYPHPGYQIMLHLQVKSELLRLLLLIIEETRERLDEYDKFRGKEDMEECAKYALLLLEVALDKQNAFYEAHSAANCPVLLSGLNRMLLDVNPRSSKPDHVLNIMKFVTYNSWLPRHTLAAIRILTAVTTLPNVSAEILTMFPQGCVEQQEIRQGFVECLEVDVRSDPVVDDDYDDDVDDDYVDHANESSDMQLPSSIQEQVVVVVDGHVQAQTQTQQAQEVAREQRQQDRRQRIELEIKLAIVKLFQMNMNQPLPNFIYYLLGVSVVRDFMANQKQQLAIEMTCSCINSLVLFIERFVDTQRQNVPYCKQTARVVERICNLLNGLCSNRRLAETILRYFRLTCNDFLLRHLSVMPFKYQYKDYIMHAMSHLMNCVAVEIKLASVHGQTTRFNLLCDILLVSGVSGGGGGAPGTGGTGAGTGAGTTGSGNVQPQRRMSMDMNINMLTLTPPQSQQPPSSLPPMSASAYRNRSNLYPIDMLPSNCHLLPARKSPMQESALGLHVSRLLDCIDLDVEPLTMPSLQFFDATLCHQLLRECESPSIVTPNCTSKLISVRKLNDVLQDEVCALHNTLATGQRNAINDEITILLTYAIQLNDQRMQSCATLNFMGAWCTMVQILFSTMPEAALSYAMRKQIIIELVEKVLIKVEPMQPLIEVSVQVTETLLLLLGNLRVCFYQLDEQRALDEHGASSTTTTTITSTTTTSNTHHHHHHQHHHTVGGMSNMSNVGVGIGVNANASSISILPGGQSIAKNGNKPNSTNLRFILKQLLDWIMLSEDKSQRLRINLYTALLQCLRIVKTLYYDTKKDYDKSFATRLDPKQNYVSKHVLGDSSPKDNSNGTTGTGGGGVLDGSLNSGEDDEDIARHMEMPADVIASFGEKLIDTICHDAINGHDVCRMLAFACIDMISELHAFHSLSEFITMHGYVKYLLNTLRDSNDALCDILQAQPDNVRPLYVYESRMAFLTRMTHSHTGAGLLLGEGVLGVLANMSVYDQQPDVKATVVRDKENSNFLQTIDDRFLSILLPALSLCDGILNSLLSCNSSAALQVLNFLFAHIDMIESMLRTATPFMDIGYMRQLAAITNLFARTTKHDITALEESLDVQHDHKLRNRLNRLQQLIITLFGRFTVNDTTIKHMLQQAQSYKELTDAEKNLYVRCFLDIAANLSLYCRNIVTSQSCDTMTSKFLLTTVVNDVTLLTGNSDSKKLNAIMLTILGQLKGAIGYYLSQKSIADNLLQQRTSLANISFGPSGKRNWIELSQRYSEKCSELMQSVFIAEQNLYLLWIHLDFYLRNTIIYAQENRNSINEINLDPANVSVLNASHDEILELKQTLISTFNETFCTQLITASESYAIKCKDFNSALLRRIKALVQLAPVK